ncbi:MAG TPA: hypothetical protein VIM11_09035 [Tepidisphaeraceae bacterium]|jgi:hypothetical protein
MSGCAQSAFDIAQPPQFAQQIERDRDTTLKLSPLEYRFRSVEDRLVLRVYNASSDPISLLGPDSYLVDPEGQSHPLLSQTIPPQSFIKLILPPLPPDRTPEGPSIAFGVSSSGLGIDTGQSALERAAAPRNNVDQWSWGIDQSVRLTFRFQRGSDPPFTHSFSLRRHAR